MDSSSSSSSSSLSSSLLLVLLLLLLLCNIGLMIHIFFVYGFDDFFFFLYNRYNDSYMFDEFGI